MINDDDVVSGVGGGLDYIVLAGARIIRHRDTPN
jgi:hypothetical protein